MATNFGVTTAGARPGSTVPGAVVGYNPATGGVPTVPNLIDIYGQATAANQGQLPGLENLAGGVNQFNQAQLIQNLRSSLPGYDAMTGASSENIEDLLAGRIPADVSGAITQGAAERGIATGMPGSPNSNAALLRALGLTSLGLQGQGESELTAAIGRTPLAQPFDISKLMVNPTDLYEAQLLANIYASAPQPAAATAALLGEQRAGYNQGRSNVPGVTSPGGTSTPYTPITRSTGGSPSTGTTPTGTGSSMIAGSPQGDWVYDPLMDAFYNNLTGQYSQNPGGPSMPGVSYSGLYGSGQGWQWDDALGAYWNPQTMEVSSVPGSTDTGASSPAPYSDEYDFLGGFE